MPRTAAFESGVARYERWFAVHGPAFRAELAALRAAMPTPGFALEVGVGTGRFALPLGVAVGLDPAGAMLATARARGILCARGVAEALPFRDGCFDHVLVVTTICFVDDPRAMLAEIRRVLRPGGAAVLGFVDRETALGQFYLANRERSAFYKEATFYSAAEIAALLVETGFANAEWRQTLAGPIDTVTEHEPVLRGTGQAAFVAVRARRGDHTDPPNGRPSRPFGGSV
ncbi:MAG: class I SAM-dependent methyltransferase [Rhodospirillales bacterium]|nr:class I SAM-dependent methyltransferase [Rhodospirillales bacterium]